MVNIFQDTTKVAPKKDGQIVRISMEQDEISGRMDHMPKAEQSVNGLRHVPNEGSKE